jgi:hypothetical protein
MLLGLVLVALTWTNYAFSDPGASNSASFSKATPDPEPEPTPDPDPESTPDTSPDDSADYEVTDEGTIHVLSGTFDGGGESYDNIGDGSQDEGQPAVFEL